VEKYPQFGGREIKTFRTWGALCANCLFVLRRISSNVGLLEPHGPCLLPTYLTHYRFMFSTRQAAAKLGIGAKTLSRYIADKKVPAPKILNVGRGRPHGWTEEDIERLRALLPKIANGRKTRYQKQAKKQTTRKPKR
jgi:predicted DNA-binding transcriptional regulator AlpA